jgi:transcriptional regulator GlxA family with amidase domain
MNHRVTMLVYGDAQSLDIVGPLEVFARTDRWLRDHHGKSAYEIELVAGSAELIRMSNGLLIGPCRKFRDLSGTDTLLVTGGIGWKDAASDEDLLAWLREFAPRVGRLAGICTGALVLAAAGLTKGKAVTTHWAYLDRLAEIDPDCTVDRSSIFVRSDQVITSAGVTAGMDMALHLIEEDHGKTVALHVAQQLVLFLRRPGHQAQFSQHVITELRDTRFAALELWVLENIESDLKVRTLAARAGLSERHFIRRFTIEVGSSPAVWVRSLRLAAARRQIEQGTPSLKDVAKRCGFGDEQGLRRAFVSALGVTPSDYAVRFG